MKRKVITALLAATMVASLAVGCGNKGGDSKSDSSKSSSSDEITIGFSQVGAESDWRTANSESMKSTFSEKNGYKLIFDDAQQKQENQITAIRNFIQQDVDYIVLAPVTETGWDTVLKEAKECEEQILILCDIKGGSVHTSLSKLAVLDNVMVFSGMNMGLVLDAVMKGLNGKLELAEANDLIEAAKDGMTVMNGMTSEDDEDF